MTYTARHASTETITEELAYDPYAQIVYNASPNFYSGVEPKLVTADVVTSAIRNEDNLRKQNLKLNDRIDNVREYLVENYDELEAHADEIARFLDIDLTNEVTVDVNVTFSVTMELPIGITADSVDGTDFSFDLISENSDYEITDYDTYVIYCNEA